jgi:1-acyl-sn-glycerol-3-phosphate acyltransferase
MTIPFFFRPFTGFIITTLLTSSVIFINGLQTASLVVLLVSRKAFRSFNRFCADTWWSACVFTIQKLNGTRLVLSGDELPRLENAIVISNHQKMVDILVVMTVAKPKGRLGDLKWFVKDIIKYFPGIGWGMLFLDCLYVKRNWDADKDHIQATFSKFLKYKIPIWLISFVEGTRVTPTKLEKSHQFARQRGLPEFKNLLLPRTKGFAASVLGLSEHVDAVYDFTIGYPGSVPSLWKVLSGNVERFHVHVRRYPISEIKKTADLSKWLTDRFVEKDQLLTRFHKTQSFV